MSEASGRRGHRRVHVPGAPGADPAPKTEPRDDEPTTGTDDAPSWSSNDDRLRRDVPPHW